MPESPSFNLIDQPWIPCLRLGARQPELFSLRGLLTQAHTLREIYADSPLVTASLYRLCLAVLHAALLGPKNQNEWSALWTRRADGFNLTDKIAPYLDRWHSAFDLFGKKPFYQVDYALLRKKKEKVDVDDDADDKVVGKPVVFVMLGVDENMATLFSHYTTNTEHSLSLPRAAQELVTAQAFVTSAGNSDTGYTKDAPWARGVIFIAEGDTLCETLLLNLVRYPPNPKSFKYQLQKGDRPIWELKDPFDEDHEIPAGYLHYLTWPSRRIIFSPPEQTERGYVVKRLRFAQGWPVPEDLVDPIKRYRKNLTARENQPAWSCLTFRPEHGLWRDSATLFDASDREKNQRPAVCDWLAELVDEKHLDSHRQYRLMALGMSTEPGRPNIDFARAEHLPLRLEFLTNEALVGKLSRATTDAENVGKALRRALKELAWGLVENRPLPKEWSAKAPAQTTEQPNTKKTRGKKATNAEGEDDKDYDYTDKELKSRDALVKSWGEDAFYWSELETEFWKFTNELADAKDDPAKQIAVSQAWRNTLREKAHAALEQAERYAGNSPRAFKAMTVAQWKLNVGLKRWIGAAPKRSVDESSATVEGETQ